LDKQARRGGKGHGGGNKPGGQGSTPSPQQPPAAQTGPSRWAGKAVVGTLITAGALDQVLSGFYRKRDREARKAMNTPTSVLNPFAFGDSWKPEGFKPFEDDWSNRVAFQSAALAGTGASLGILGTVLGRAIAKRNLRNKTLSQIEDGMNMESPQAFGKTAMRVPGAAAVKAKLGAVLSAVPKIPGKAWAGAKKLNTDHAGKRNKGLLMIGGSLGAGTAASGLLTGSWMPSLPGKGAARFLDGWLKSPFATPGNSEFWGYAAPVGAVSASVILGSALAASIMKKRDKKKAAETDPVKHPILEEPSAEEPVEKEASNRKSLVDKALGIQGLFAMLGLTIGGVGAYKYTRATDKNQATIDKLIEEHKRDNMRRDYTLSGLHPRILEWRAAMLPAAEQASQPDKGKDEEEDVVDEVASPTPVDVDDPFAEILRKGSQ